MARSYINESEAFSLDVIKKLTNLLSPQEALFGSLACVYATGSFGRFEAGKHSDLDIFLVSFIEKIDGVERRRLSHINEIRLQSALIECAQKLNLPEFDGDGRFMSCHTINDFVVNLGGPQDDAQNTLTGRMLLLLESKPLLGGEIYDRLIDEVLKAYFKDFPGNELTFVPAFLLNDILRMWRTFCVNYEYHRKPESNKAKIKVLKLKYSRLLTCYSAVLFLLQRFSENGTLLQEDVKEMISLSPTQRLVRVSQIEEGEVSDLLDTALNRYADFLAFSHLEPNERTEKFKEDPEFWRKNSYDFGDSIGRVMMALSRKNEKSERFFRLALV